MAGPDFTSPAAGDDGQFPRYNHAAQTITWETPAGSGGTMPDGTVAAPGLAFDLDSDTGFWRPGADILAVSAGGAEQLRVDTSGILVPRVKLDVLDPSGARYAIQQNTGTFESGLYSDTTFNFGYNVSATPGVKAVADEPMLFTQFESKFRQNSSSPYGSEYHLNFQRPAQTSGLARPLSVFMEHDAAVVDVAIAADTFAVSTSAGDQVINSTASAVFMHQNLSVAAPQIEVGTGATTATLRLNAATAASFQIDFRRAGVQTWLVYNASGANLYVRDIVNASMHMTLIPAATVASAYTDFRSNIRAYGNQADFGPATNKLTVGSLGTGDAWVDAGGTNANVTLNLRSKGTGSIISLTAHQFSGNVGFYGTAPIAKQTGVAVDAASIHAALVNLGLIAA